MECWSATPDHAAIFDVVHDQRSGVNELDGLRSQAAASSDAHCGRHRAVEQPIAEVHQLSANALAAKRNQFVHRVQQGTAQYLLDGVLPSDATGYVITETQPATYADGAETVGRLNGTAAGALAGNDRIGGLVYTGGSGDGYDFGEQGASIAGTVFNDVNGNGKREPGDLPLAGVTLTLTGTDASGQPVTRSTVTARDGSYRFVDLPLDNGAGYTIVQSPVPGSTHAGETPGSLGGSVPAPGRLNVKLPAVAANGTGYDFFEKFTSPAAVSGRVWRDTDHDRLAGSSEPAVAGWTVELVACLDGGTTYTGAEVSGHFDSMLAKLTCRGRDFATAVARARRAVAEFRIRGVATNIPFLQAVLDDPDFRAGRLTTSFIDDHPQLLTARSSADRDAIISARATVPHVKHMATTCVGLNRISFHA